MSRPYKRIMQYPMQFTELAARTPEKHAEKASTELALRAAQHAAAYAETHVASARDYENRRATKRRFGGTKPGRLLECVCACACERVARRVNLRMYSALSVLSVLSVGLFTPLSSGLVWGARLGCSSGVLSTATPLSVRCFTLASTRSSFLAPPSSLGSQFAAPPSPPLWPFAGPTLCVCF